MMIVFDVTYLTSGVSGIMFGHDILDAFYVIGQVYACFLVFAGEPRQQAAATTDEAASLPERPPAPAENSVAQPRTRSPLPAPENTVRQRISRSSRSERRAR
jgi:hypothetical protein